MSQQKQAIHELSQLLRQLRPVLHDGCYLFCTVPTESAEKYYSDAIFCFKEAEGTSLVLPEEIAQEHQLNGIFPSAWISLQVNSALDAVGLTAAVSSALSDAQISCNVVAAYHHDHLFVPIGKASLTMQILENLSRNGLRE